MWAGLPSIRVRRPRTDPLSAYAYKRELLRRDPEIAKGMTHSLKGNEMTRLLDESGQAGPFDVWLALLARTNAYKRWKSWDPRFCHTLMPVRDCRRYRRWLVSHALCETAADGKHLVVLCQAFQRTDASLVFAGALFVSDYDRVIVVCRLDFQ